MLKRNSLSFTIAMALALTGCATLFGGSTTVPVASNPPGAGVYVNGQLVAQTPTIIELDSSRPANIQIYMPGYQPVQVWRSKTFSGWFWVNILFWPGFIVDIATGKWQRYDNGVIAVGLVPAADGGQPPPGYQPGPTYQQPAPQPYYPPQPPPGPAPVQPGVYQQPPPPPTH